LSITIRHTSFNAPIETAENPKSSTTKGTKVH
jgi:hypothetical protein